MVNFCRFQSKHLNDPRKIALKKYNTMKGNGITAISKSKYSDVSIFGYSVLTISSFKMAFKENVFLDSITLHKLEPIPTSVTQKQPL